jgi:hypothetical protein
VPVPVILDEAAVALLDEGGSSILDEAGDGGGQYQFIGDEVLIYPDYIDVQAGHTLVATPLSIYQMEPAGLGDPTIDADNPVPPPDSNWIAQ